MTASSRAPRRALAALTAFALGPAGLSAAVQPAAAMAAATPAVARFLAASDGASEPVRVASALDVLRSLGPRAAPAAEALSGLLPFRSKLYQDRDKMLVIRLRAYLLVTLAEIGFPDSARWALLDILAHVDERMVAQEVGAAARAVRSLGAGGRAFGPYLLDALMERFSEEEFSLERFDPRFPRHEATTVQLEVVRALGRIASIEDREALEVLRQLAASRVGGERDRRVIREARTALALIAPAGGRSRGARP